MYFTSDSDRAFEQPQPRPEQPDEAAPGLENSVLENPTSDNPTPGNPTLENPMQLNKDISSKEKTTTDVSITDSIPILSRPFPSEDEAAQPPERKGTGAKSQSAIEIYREIIMDNIEYEHLCQHAKGIDRETLDEIVDLLVETVCSVRKTIRIAGDDYPAELVKSKFMKLDSSHIEFVFDCLSKNTSEIKNDEIKNAHVNTSEIRKLLLDNIQSSKEIIARKKKNIKHLQEEIDEEQQRINEAERLIKELDEKTKSQEEE